MNTRAVGINTQYGSSMIEVVVTMFILSVGLLGVAGLQSTGLRQTASSQMAVQAQILGQDLAEMIIAFDDKAEGIYELAAVPSTRGTDCMTVLCTGAQLAQYNVWTWAQNMQPGLPSYDIDIDFTEATRSYDVSLTWDSNKDGSNYSAPTCTAADGLKPGCFAMLVEL